jgi:hypothetical protein
LAISASKTGSQQGISAVDLVSGVLQKFGPVKGQFNRPIARTQEFGPLCNLQLGRLTAMLFS